MKHDNGFTLLELLLSLTILAIIIALCFGVFQTGVRAWEKGEIRTAANQQARIVPELLRRQLASIRLPKVFRRDGADFFFAGTEKSLEFFSAVPLLPEHRGEIVHVIYRAGEAEDRQDDEETAELLFHEMRIMNLTAEQVDELAEEAFTPLFTGLRTMSFSYLPQPNATPLASDRLQEELSDPWLPAWDPTLWGDILPKAVRITLESADEEKPLVIIVPLQAWTEPK
ncbi:MAG: prepilin-type N-terminal cleavage/methylation domain-containing protein [Thermodesulfobacteriota bacterium]